MKSILTTLFLVSMFLIVSCNRKSIGYSQEASIEGIMEYKTSKDFDEKLIRVHYFLPQGDIEKMKVQIVLHGATRNADEYLDGWKEKAQIYGLIVLSLEFSNDQFSISQYSQGMMQDTLGRLNLDEKTLFHLTDQIFLFVKEKLDLDQPSYNLYGHSAGGQFVHRFVQFHESPYLNQSVAANPGWYTYPNEKVKFPYGLGGLNKDFNSLKSKYYSKDLIILLGTADTLRTNNFRITKEADAQGLTRLERGIKYHDWNKSNAFKNNLIFNWKINYVKDAGHEHVLMSEAAADLLYRKK